MSSFFPHVVYHFPFSTPNYYYREKKKRDKGIRQKKEQKKKVRENDSFKYHPPRGRKVSGD